MFLSRHRVSRCRRRGGCRGRRRRVCRRGLRVRLMGNVYAKRRCADVRNRGRGHRAARGRDDSPQRNNFCARRWRRDLWRGRSTRGGHCRGRESGNRYRRDRWCCELLLDKLVDDGRVVRSAILADELDRISGHLGGDIEGVFGAASALNLHGEAFRAWLVPARTVVRQPRVLDSGVNTNGLYHRASVVAIRNSPQPAGRVSNALRYWGWCGCYFKLLRNSTRFRRSCFVSTWRSSSGMPLKPRWRSLMSAFFSLRIPSSGEFTSISSGVSFFNKPA